MLIRSAVIGTLIKSSEKMYLNFVFSITIAADREISLLGTSFSLKIVSVLQLSTLNHFQRVVLFISEKVAFSMTRRFIKADRTLTIQSTMGSS